MTFRQGIQIKSILESLLLKQAVRVRLLPKELIAAWQLEKSYRECKRGREKCPGLKLGAPDACWVAEVKQVSGCMDEGEENRYGVTVDFSSF